MQDGDPSLRVVNHPKAGKILVAARSLPKGYRMALWGRMVKENRLSEKAKEWAFEVMKKWYLDPTKFKGSKVQFCPCAGPGEVAAITPCAGSMYRGEDMKYGSWTFKTL